MTVALVYARASSDPTDQKISVDRQIKLCTARARQLWPDAEVKAFRDDAITAADPNVYRPGFAAFLNAVRSTRKGELVGVVVNEQSRLTRQGTGAWDQLVVTLTKAGITTVETLRSGPISVEPGSRAFGRIMAVLDTEEVERTKARVQDAHRELFTEGRPSGRAPFGYRSIRDEKGRPNLEPDPIEAPVVRQVFDMALAGSAISVIVDKLNAGEVLPRSTRWKFKDGRRLTGWKANSVRDLLTSPSVAGLRAHTDEDGQLHTVPAKWEALIDVDQWRAVQRLLAQPTMVVGANGTMYRVRTKPAAQPRKYLLSGGRKRSGVEGELGELYGVLRCGKCGYPLIAQTQGRRDGRRVPAYQCHPKIDPAACGGVSISPAEAVEQLVVKAIQRRLAESPGLRKRLDAVTDAEASQWRVERDAAKARMLQAAEMLGAGQIDRDEFDVMRTPAKAALELAESSLASLTTDTALPSFEDVEERWDYLTLKQQRAVVERLIDRIDIAPSRGGYTGFDPDRVGTPQWLA
jgi:DNA invertase Pin-like site-specific DNA recombinase